MTQLSHLIYLTMEPVTSRSYSLATASSFVFVTICVSLETAHIEFSASPV